MWTWQQTGTMITPEGLHWAGYSGKGVHKNDPDSQQLECLGPIPCGVYRIGDPHDSPLHGPYCLPLTPDIANVMFGRSGFLIHGDSIEHPGAASEGCIILMRSQREAIYRSGDRMLVVEPRPQHVATNPGIEAE